MKGEVVMNIAEHNVLTLDYWRDEVSYEGITLPSGNIGCAALNISDAVIAELKQICQPLQAVIDAVGKCKLSRISSRRPETAFCRFWRCCRKKTLSRSWITRIT